MNLGKQNLCAVILAGGKGTRIENLDKPLIKLGHQALIQWVLEKVEPRVSQVLVSVNHNSSRYKFLNLPLISDVASQYQGPLVGIYSALKWIENNGQSENYTGLVCVPADVPMFPGEIITKLEKEFEQHPCDVVYCSANDQIQPLFSIWSLACTDKIQASLDAGRFGPKLIFPELRSRVLHLETNSQTDFLNINDEKSFSIAQKLVKTI